MDARAGAIIFGGARGIGAATARALVANGFRLLICDVLDDDGSALAAELGAAFIHCDVAEKAQISAAFDEFDALDAELKLVFNNVGIARYGQVEDLADSDWELTLAVNLTAQFQSAKFAVPRLRESGGGVIVNTSSVLGHASQKGTAAYAASKAAVLGLTRTIAIDHAREGIRCVSISPGTIDTPLVQIAASQFGESERDALRAKWAEAHPLGRLGLADEVAAAVLFLASPGAGFITGSDILIDGGITSELYK